VPTLRAAHEQHSEEARTNLELGRVHRGEPLVEGILSAVAQRLRVRDASVSLAQQVSVTCLVQQGEDDVDDDEGGHFVSLKCCVVSCIGPPNKDRYGVPHAK
jgi:hypothetical protein